ncbi:C-terminal helicase domain-containing protein [Desulfitobacterium sp. THU1]|uniref:DEAD/DEAH box helicase n=1 Tax=Desulfitobacterium sp. THU1 TaxID=3138072 RepID=UPI00311F1073
MLESGELFAPLKLTSKEAYTFLKEIVIYEGAGILCRDHPDQYLGREEYKPENSGKFEQLREICETIYEKRERVLVFTQFREMTEPISDFLKSIFLKEGLVLHGGTPVKKRNQMVEQFNGEHYIPYMVLSLKAGGVGLNLTAANHVIHFDRWWNPAVENQATDRAFRIGQTKNVMVHKFVTKGTVEEKIDAMIMKLRPLVKQLRVVCLGISDMVNIDDIHNPTINRNMLSTNNHTKALLIQPRIRCHRTCIWEILQPFYSI